MKNIFKSLMFVAVAAMTFTACEKDNAENTNNNGTEQKTAITFNAEFADTRSYFTENNGEGYASAWTEGDAAIFTHTSYCYSDGANIVANTQSGGSAKFEVVFYGQNPNKNDTIVAVSPASAWKAQSVYDYNVGYAPIGWEHTYKIPTTQTPSATSVDEAAHIIKAETTYTGDNNISLTFEHQVAYGKLSLTNFAGTDATDVLLDIDGDKYTINLDNINIATEPIWFACEPIIDDKVSNMTVTVNATEGSYTKQIITGGDKNLEFLQGQVSTFIVDMKDVTSGEAVDTFNPDVNMTYNSLSGDTLKFNAEGYSYIYLYLNNNDHTSNSIKTGTYKCSGGAVAPAQSGKIGVKYSDGSSTTIKDTNMDIIVDFDGNDYIITFTYSDTLYGYKGMPNGWVAPTGSIGGNEEPAIDLTGYTKCVLNSISQGSVGIKRDFIAVLDMTDTSSENIKITLSDMDGGISVNNKTIKTGDYTFMSDSNSYTYNMEAYDFYAYGMNLSSSTTGTVKVYNDNGTYTILLDMKYNSTVLKYYYQGTL